IGQNLSISVASGAAVTFGASQRLGALHVADGGVATMPANGSRYLQTKLIDLMGSGRLALNDNDLIVDYDGGMSPFTSVQQSVIAGLDGTSGITGADAVGGSTILGLIDNVNLG